MLTIVDRHNGVIIHKVTTPRGKFLRYQTMPEGTYDTSKAGTFKTLTEARESIGHKIVAKVELTAPKSSYAQNTSGYKAQPKGAAPSKQRKV